MGHGARSKKAFERRAFATAPNGRIRRIHVIAAHSGEGPFVVRFADLANAAAFDFRLRLAPTEYPTI